MSENEIEKQTANLKVFASSYVKNKTELSSLEKKCDSLNASIKQLMETLKLDFVRVGKDKEIRYSIQTRESLDEERLIKLLKELAPDTNCIKTKEYIDMDVLENEIYHGELSDDALCAMDSCRKIKSIPRLDIKKVKDE